MQRLLIRTVSGSVLSLSTAQLAIIGGVAVVAILAAAWVADRICEEHDVHVDVRGGRVDLT